jgi:hypothetical protein
MWLMAPCIPMLRHPLAERLVQIHTQVLEVLREVHAR